MWNVVCAGPRGFKSTTQRTMANQASSKTSRWGIHILHIVPLSKGSFHCPVKYLQSEHHACCRIKATMARLVCLPSCLIIVSLHIDVSRSRLPVPSSSSHYQHGVVNIYKSTYDKIFITSLPRHLRKSRVVPICICSAFSLVRHHLLTFQSPVKILRRQSQHPSYRRKARGPSQSPCWPHSGRRPVSSPVCNGTRQRKSRYLSILEEPG